LNKKSIKILAWPKESNQRSNPYNYNLYRYFKSNVFEFKKFQINFRFDIYHIHWPETYLLCNNIFKYFIGSCYVLFVLFFFKIFKKKIIWTVHNIKPHFSYYTFFNTFFYKALNTLTDKYIFLNNRDFHSIKSDNKIIIRHGLDLISQNKYNLLKKETQNYFLFFGGITKYKNIDLVIRNFNSFNYSNIKLLIIGKSYDNDYLSFLNNLSNSNDNIEIIPEFVLEDKLYEYIINSIAVLIPYSNNNSGVLYKSLECRKQVVTIYSELNEEFSKLFGSDKIIQHDFSKLIEFNLNTDLSRFENLGQYHWSKIAQKTENFIIND